MREDTFEKRLRAWKDQLAYPHGREKGDLISHPEKVKMLAEPITVRLMYMEANHEYAARYYNPTRWYSISVEPSKIPADFYTSMVVTITKWDLSEWALATTQEQNMMLEEIWLRNGGK